jgi:S-DNA-T family DNA segregation ATPase FtsK/SpoIIIE
MLEVLLGGTLVGGYLFTSFHWSDRRKLDRILKITLRNDFKLHRKTKYFWGIEYAFKIPLGLSFEKIELQKNAIQDGLNIKLKGQQKVIEMDYDGMLRIRVYDFPLHEMVPYDKDLLAFGSDWNVPIGVTHSEIVFHDYDIMPHQIIAGMTRYGKTVFLKGLITNIAVRRPETAKLTLIDLKGGLAFGRFKSLRMVESVASNLEETHFVLSEIKNKMDQRLIDFKNRGYEDIKESRLKERHFIVIDEAAEIASKGTADNQRLRKECESILSHIARIGGGLGYRLIFCTQYPTGDTLPRQVKQNCDSKICFRLPTEVASEVVLDEKGAESLPQIKGRAIYKTDCNKIIQVPYIENALINEVLAPFRRVDDEQPAQIETTDRANPLVIG